MNDWLVLSAVAWLIAIPLALALWLSPKALLTIKRHLVARADGLTASRAAYKVAHDAALSNGPDLRHCGNEIELEGNR